MESHVACHECLLHAKLYMYLYLLIFSSNFLDVLILTSGICFTLLFFKMLAVQLKLVLLLSTRHSFQASRTLREIFQEIPNKPFSSF